MPDIRERGVEMAYNGHYQFSDTEWAAAFDLATHERLMDDDARAVPTWPNL